MRIEFYKNPVKDETSIFIWEGMLVVDKYIMPGEMSKASREKFKETYIKKQKDK